MSTSQHSKSVLLTLLGTLTFTLSTLPEVAERMDQSSIDRMPAEAQVEDCVSTLRALKNSASANCRVTGAVKTGNETSVDAEWTVEVRKSEKTRLEKFVDEKEVAPPNIEQEFEVTFTEGTATCKNCDLSVAMAPTKYVIPVRQYNDARALANFIKEKAEREVKLASQKVREERKRRAALENCDEDESGQILRGRLRMECQTEKIAGMDEEKAADQFHKHMKNDLLSLMQSSNPQDVTLASQILGKLNSETSSSAVRESVQDLVRYGQFSQRQNQMISSIAMLQVNDPYRYTLAQQLYGERQQANAYFQMRGLNLDRQNQQALMTNSWLQSITPAMIRDVNSYSQDINARYNAIVDRLRVTMENSTNLVDPMGRQFNPTTSGSSGRTQRGQPLAPGGQYSTVPSSGNVTTTTPSGLFNGPTFNGQTPLVNGGAPARMIPQAGQPVSPQQLQNRGVAR